MCKWKEKCEDWDVLEKAARSVYWRYTVDVSLVSWVVVSLQTCRASCSLCVYIHIRKREQLAGCQRKWRISQTSWLEWFWQSFWKRSGWLMCGNRNPQRLSRSLSRWGEGSFSTLTGGLEISESASIGGEIFLMIILELPNKSGWWDGLPMSSWLLVWSSLPHLLVSPVFDSITGKSLTLKVPFSMVKRESSKVQPPRSCCAYPLLSCQDCKQ